MLSRLLGLGENCWLWVRRSSSSKRSASPIATGRTFGRAGESLEQRQLLSASGNGHHHGNKSAEVHGVTAKILNGTPTNAFPSVGLVGDDQGNDCTGTLIAPQWVLTAAHCSVDLGNPDGRFTINGSTYTTELVAVHPDYNPKKFNSNKANDIALWKLSEPVVGVDPSPIYRETPQVGTLLTLVGFGSGGTLGGEFGDFGIKRAGTTPLEKVTPTRIRWVFNSPNESNTGHGDSGGPAFIKVDDTYYVAGITSGGTKFNAGRGDHAFDTRVDAFQNWIDNVMNGAVNPNATRKVTSNAHQHGLDLCGDNISHTKANDAVMSDIMQHL